MKKELLKKMKYEMPGMAKGPKGKGPMPEDMASDAEDLEVEISMGPESEEEVGMPKMAMEEEGPEMEMDEEMEMPDLAGFSDEELMAELKKRKAKPAMA
jgi:hypothetical protein